MATMSSQLVKAASMVGEDQRMMRLVSFATRRWSKRKYLSAPGAGGGVHVASGHNAGDDRDGRIHPECRGRLT